MADMVKSVEFIEITQGTGSTLSTIDLTKGQNYQNCVPFMTLHGGQDYQDSHLTDIYFGGTVASGVINFQRATTRSTNIYIKCFVVEFEPAEIKVQQGSFSSLPGGTTTNYTTPSSFTQNKTAMKHYWRSSSGNRRWDTCMVRGRVDSGGTYVDMYRNEGSGTVSGHYFLFEDISATNEHFNVTHNSSSFTGTAQDKRPAGATSDRNDPTKTWVIFSWAPTDDGYYCDRSTVRVWSYFKTFWRCDRSNSTGTIYPSWQLITFNDDSKVYISDQRELSLGASGVTTGVWNFNRPVNLNKAMIVTNGHVARGTTTATTQIDSLWVSHKFNSTTQAQRQRNSDGGGNTSYEGATVIDWGGIVINTGTNPSPLDPDITPVKSVETFRIYNYTYWDYYDLTKGQDISNCAVFAASRGEGCSQIREHKCVTWLREPGVAITHRTDATGDAYVDISVVEFYPDQVKVEYGEFTNWGSTTETMTLASGVDTSKAFILNNWEQNEGTWFSRSSIRSRFVSSGDQVEFYRNDAGNSVHGVYWVVEDLTGNWIDVYHNTGNVTTYRNVYTPSWGSYYSRFELGSYAVSTDNYYTDRATARVGHTPSGHRVFTNRITNADTMYSHVQVITFLDNRRHLYLYAPTLDTGESQETGTIPTRHLGNEDAWTVFNASLNNVGRTDGTGSNDFRGAFHVYRLVTSNTQVECSRDTPAGTNLNPSYGGLIDWIGYAHPDADEKFNSLVNTSNPTNSLVRNIHHIEGTTGSVRYNYLPNGMNADNCVPFASWRAGASNGYQVYLQRKWHMDTVNSAVIGSAEAAGSGGTTDESVYIVEFDPRQVKIQRIEYVFTGTSAAVNIPEAVDLTKTFMQFHMVSDDWGAYQSRNKVRGKFTDSSTLHFQRENSANAVMVSIYIVECLQDQWYVSHVVNDTSAGSNTNFYDYANFSGGWGQHVRFLIGSYTPTTDNYYTDRANYRLYPRQDHGIQWNKSSSADALYRRACEVIQFNPAYGIRNGGYWTDLSSGVTSETKGSIGHYWNMDRSVACMSMVSSQGSADGTGANDSNASCHKVVLTDSNTATITNYNGGNSSWNWFQWIEWPEYKTHYFEGTITERDVPISRPVACFRADTNERVDYTVSASGTGYYRLETSYSGTHYIVCQDDDLPVDYNHLVLGKMDPYPITQDTVWGDGYDGGSI